MILGWLGLCMAQLGGQTGGVFILDDAEDLDINAAGVNRDWISDYTFKEIALRAIDPTTASLILAPHQSPAGVFRLQANNDLTGFFFKSCGVPLPSQKGESTLIYPGNATSFETLSFLACINPTANDMELQIILECYPRNPDGTYPKLYWFMTPAVGLTFSQLTVSLMNPDLVENADGRSVWELLSQTRFLSLFLYAGPDMSKQNLYFYFDDIVFSGEVLTKARPAWSLYE